MKPGDEVQHPLLGGGRVVAVYAKGGQAGAEVDFGYMADWVSAAALGEQSVNKRESLPLELQVSGGRVPETTTRWTSRSKMTSGPLSPLRVRASRS